MSDAQNQHSEQEALLLARNRIHRYVQEGHLPGDENDPPHDVVMALALVRLQEQFDAVVAERDGYYRQSQDQAEEAIKWRILAEADRKAAVQAGERAVRFEDALMLAACEVVGESVGIEEQQALFDRWLRDSNPAKRPT